MNYVNSINTVRHLLTANTNFHKSRSAILIDRSSCDFMCIHVISVKLILYLFDMNFLKPDKS